MNRHKILDDAKEDILRAIIELQTSSTEEIKQVLSIPETFTEAMNQLVKDGFVHLNEQSVNLTPSGEEAARIITNSHRTIEEYFKQEVDSEEAHRIADILEHVIAEEVAHSLKRIRQLDERGSPLSGEESGEGLITRVNLDNSQLFSRMISMGICPGQWITIIRRIRGGLILLVGNTQLAVGMDIVNSIEVMFP